MPHMPLIDGPFAEAKEIVGRGFEQGLSNLQQLPRAAHEPAVQPGRHQPASMRS